MASDPFQALPSAAPDGSVVRLAPGTYRLDGSLQIRGGVELRGAGAGRTILEADPSWRPALSGSVDDGVDFTKADPSAYLIELGRDVSVNAGVHDMTLRGPNLHGAVVGITSHGFKMTGNEVRDFAWSGVRTFVTNNAEYRDNVFVDAGGVSPSGVSGGGLHLTYEKGATIANNRFETTDGRSFFYGVKGREFRDTRITDNTILTDFAIELPFEQDRRVEIARNHLAGVVSVPRFNGGEEVVEGDGDGFHIHHNHFTTSYAIEGPRNNLRIDHNLFDLDAGDNGGNLISVFGNEASGTIPGPLSFTDNLVRNPGLGVFWSDIPHDDIRILRNHVLADETGEGEPGLGLFSFRVNQGDGDATDFSTITIADNIVGVLTDDPSDRRDLLRYPAEGINVSNIELIGVGDLLAYPNEDTGAPRGPDTPLLFRVGRNGEYLVDGFSATLVPEPAGAALLAGLAPPLTRRRRGR